MRIWFIVIATLFAALALQAGLLAFAMYALLGILLLSRYFSRTWVAGLTVTRDTRAAEPAEIGDVVEVSLTVTNNGSITVVWVLIEDLLPKYALNQKPARLDVKGKRLKIVRLGAGKSTKLKYSMICRMRGYYQIGPTLLETGDLFGLHRRHRVATMPIFLLVYPRVMPLPKYDFVSQRPLGEITMAHRLFEDPTRNSGVRPYQVGDPLQRVHWRATARTGELQCRVFEPTSLAGATILLDFHRAGYHQRGEPYRSELGITTAVSLAYAVSILNQQLGLVSNGRDAADRVRLDVHIQRGTDREQPGFQTRDEARASGEVLEESTRLRPVLVETRRGIEQFQRIRESLARLELTDGLTFAQLVVEMMPRLPRDATVIAVLAMVPVETSSVLGMLRRQGFAVTAILLGLDENDGSQAHGRLLAEGVRDVRHVNSEEELMGLSRQTPQAGVVPYSVSLDLA